MKYPLRIWSVHPKYLDNARLGQLWREALLLQTIVREAGPGRIGRKVGGLLVSNYLHDPQVARWRADPELISAYLLGLRLNAMARDLNYDRARIMAVPPNTPTPRRKIVTLGQLLHEACLLRKRYLKSGRVQARALVWPAPPIEAHPIFTVRPGEVESWEQET